MKKAKIIVALVLLTFSLSGCANVDRSEVSAPSSQETVMAEPAQSTVPQEQATVSVSGSTEVPAEITAEPEPVETKPEVSTPAKEETPPTVSSPTETTPPKASEPEPPTEPMATQPQEPESPAEEEPTEPAFDIQTWIDYAKAYAESIGLRMEGPGRIRVSFKTVQGSVSWDTCYTPCGMCPAFNYTSITYPC